ncbi:hypothetical protein D3C83_12310 [compost metagenome]
MNGAPVARTASTCLSEISSIASVKSLPRKPTEATVSASMPASAPNPTAFTKTIATMTGWKERHTTISSRAPQVTQPGIRLRAPSRLTGSEISSPSTEARIAISRLSLSPFSRSSQRWKSGGNSLPRNFWPNSRPVRKRAGVNSRWDSA